jgi:hypothetical protein
VRINIERTILSCGFELQAAAWSKRCGRGGGAVNIIWNKCTMVWVWRYGHGHGWFMVYGLAAVWRMLAAVAEGMVLDSGTQYHRKSRRN